MFGWFRRSCPQSKVVRSALRTVTVSTSRGPTTHLVKEDLWPGAFLLTSEFYKNYTHIKELNICVMCTVPFKSVA